MPLLPALEDETRNNGFATVPTDRPAILLVKLISHQLGMPNAEIDRTVEIVDQKLNEKIVAGGSGSA